MNTRRGWWERPANARFWVWWQDGPVKITLKPGERLTAYSFSRGDEGWSSYTESWVHEGDRVTRQSTNDGRDCDGRLTQWNDDYALLIDLEQEVMWMAPLRSRLSMWKDYQDEIPWTHDGFVIQRPAWQEGKSSQRDYTAEADGKEGA